MTPRAPYPRPLPDAPPAHPRYMDHPWNVWAWERMRDRRITLRAKGSEDPSALDLAAWMWGEFYAVLQDKCLTPAIVYGIARDVAKTRPGEV